jgi:asparagine synthase (glutamine-hydrolysing)
MCGILGAVPTADPAVFASALATLTPRGPDGGGTWSDGTARLGHRRLAILDLSDRGRQPMTYAKDRYALVFNGEIYNFLELREELEGKGHRFATESDSEVMLAAYVEWGADCLPRFNGMWAFAIWDTAERTLFLSRDRFGKKPLFYTRAGGRFIFASEMKALLPFLPDIRPSPRLDWMRGHIHDYENTEECLVDGIKRFPPAHYGVYRDGHLRLTRYWNTLDHLETPPARYEDQVARFRELFVEACRIRLRSDVPVGTALSGGLDSSAVAAGVRLAATEHAGARMASDWQRTFTASFPGTSADEADYARQVAERLGAKAVTLPIEPDLSPDRLDETFYRFEELFQTVPIPMMETYGAMRRSGVVVTLDGHGGDELLSGYAESLFTAFPDCRTPGDALSVIAAYRDQFDPRFSHMTVASTGHYFRRFLREHVVRPPWMAAKAAALRVLRGPRPATSPDAADREAGPAPFFQDRGEAFERLDAFGRHLYILFHETTLPTLLRNYDRYAMSHGVEIRMPFLDHRLVSYAFSLPWRAKIRGGFTKAILRDAMRDQLPSAVVERKTKIGFGAPAVEWMKGPMRGYLEDTIRSSDFLSCPVIPDAAALGERITRLIADPAARFRDAEQAWTDFLVFPWYRAIIEQAGGGGAR